MSATDAQIHRWAALWDRGWSYRRIAAHEQVPETRVRRALAGQVTPRRPGPVARTRPTVAQVVAAWHQCGSIRAAGRQLGVSETYVRARLHVAGLARHPDRRPRMARQHPPA